MNISVRQIKAFVAAAEQGSFTRAAAQLHLTQSALSGLIKELESQLDIRLFDRTTRQLHLSAAGCKLLPPAKRIINEINLFSEEAACLKSGRHGQVRLAVSQLLAASVMPLLMAEFKKEQKEIELQLLDCSVEHVLQQVQNGEVDFGIGPERELPDDIEACELFSLPFHIVLPENHALTEKNRITWEDLLHEPLITLNGPFTFRLAAVLPDHLAQRMMSSDHQVNFLSTALSMTRNGLGLTLCLPYAAEWVRQNGLSMRPLHDPHIERHFCLYRRKNRSLSASAAIFERFLTQQDKRIWRFQKTL
ncbi:MAG: LysR family transcriptional regulator [Neisseria sp.]|nr:LysR family transcriptional regulator [Neisseria sp.]